MCIMRGAGLTYVRKFEFSRAPTGGIVLINTPSAVPRP